MKTQTIRHELGGSIKLATNETRKLLGIQGMPIPPLKGELLIRSGRRQRMQRGELIPQEAGRSALVNELADEIRETAGFIRNGPEFRSAIAVLALRAEVTLGDIAVGSRTDLEEAQRRLDALCAAGIVASSPSEVGSGGTSVYRLSGQEPVTI
jgi:hypothetical protein